MQKERNSNTRLSYAIGEHDMEIRRNQAEKFAKEGHLLKIELFLRGRDAFQDMVSCQTPIVHRQHRFLQNGWYHQIYGPPIQYPTSSLNSLHHESKTHPVAKSVKVTATGKFLTAKSVKRHLLQNKSSQAKDEENMARRISHR